MGSKTDEAVVVVASELVAVITDDDVASNKLQHRTGLVSLSDVPCGPTVVLVVVCRCLYTGLLVLGLALVIRQRSISPEVLLR